MGMLRSKTMPASNKDTFLQQRGKVASHPYGENSSQIQSDKGCLHNIVERVQVQPGNDYRKKVLKLQKVSK